ncbi:hypothetical protein ACJX0J_027396 [Zea mays]
MLLQQNHINGGNLKQNLLSHILELEEEVITPIFGKYMKFILLLLATGKFVILHRAFLNIQTICIGEESRFITMNMNDMRENGWDPLFEELLGCIACLDPWDSFANFDLEKLEMMMDLEITHMF